MSYESVLPIIAKTIVRASKTGNPYSSIHRQYSNNFNEKVKEHIIEYTKDGIFLSLDVGKEIIDVMDIRYEWTMHNDVSVYFLNWGEIKVAAYDHPLYEVLAKLENRAEDLKNVREDELQACACACNNDIDDVEMGGLGAIFDEDENENETKCDDVIVIVYKDGNETSVSLNSIRDEVDKKSGICMLLEQLGYEISQL